MIRQRRKVLGGKKKDVSKKEQRKFFNIFSCLTPRLSHMYRVEAVKEPVARGA